MTEIDRSNLGNIKGICTMKDTQIKLSRLDIVGEVVPNIPGPVLEEICLSEGLVIPSPESLLDLVYRASVLVTLQRKQPLIIEYPLEQEKLGLIARYINSDPNIRWKLGILDVSLKWLTKKEYDPEQIISRLSLGESIGLPTPEQPNKITACILYQVMLKLKLNINYNMTVEDMRRVLLAGKINRSLLMDEIQLKLASAPLTLVSEIFCMLYQNTNVMEWKTDVQELRRTYTAIRSRVSDANGILPSDHSTAIIVAAMRYNIDLSYAKNPLLEYRKYSSDPTNYIPFDEKMKYIMRVSPTSYSLNSFYNPNLPQELYSNPNLRSICQNIDLTGISMHSSSEQYIMEICSSVYTDRFYKSIHPGIIETKSVIDLIELEDDDECKQYSFLTYGSHTSNFRLFTTSGLASNLTNTHKFIDETGEPLSNEAIASLRKISERESRDNFTYPRSRNTNQFRWRELANSIIAVDEYISNSTAKFRMLESRMIDLGQRDSVIRCFKSLLDLSMYMRGWKGSSNPYPISSAKDPHQGETFRNVDRQTKIFNHNIQQLGETGRLLLDLPLCKYRSLAYVEITNPEVGRTIGEKLHIVDQGENTENINSCIRLSSNYLAVTCHKYLCLLGCEPPFDIVHLREIQ